MYVQYVMKPGIKHFGSRKGGMEEKKTSHFATPSIVYSPTSASDLSTQVSNREFSSKLITGHNPISG